MTVTIKDIARLAGVSRGTVDRALNNRNGIHPNKRDKILRIAKELGYVKNVIASNLASNNQVNVAIVLPDPQQDTFWQAPLDGIDKAREMIINYGFELTIYHFDLLDSKSFCEALDQAIQNKPQAILTAPLYYKESLQYLQIAEHNNIPFVCINSEIGHDNVLCYVGQNSYDCGYLAGRLFHQSINQPLTIATTTLGHDPQNAIHIDNKIKGLRAYNKANNCNFVIVEYALQDFAENRSIENLKSSMVSDNPDIGGIFFTNSRAHLFYKNGQPNFKNDITTVGFDLLPGNIELLESGTIDYLLNQNPVKQGYLGLITIFNHFVLKTSIKKKQYLPIDIIVKENYKGYLELDETKLQWVI